MKIFILIGGIGCGKTTVSKMFEEAGARCLDLDDVGHTVLAQPDTISTLVDTFGDGILDESGSIDRKALAKVAFATPADTVRLNAISHPRVAAIARETLKNWEAEGCETALIEISAYDGPTGTFAGFVKAADGIIAVVARKRVRLERAVAKGFDAADVEARMARQVDDVQRQLWADHVIRNEGTLDDLRRDVDAVWAKIAH